MSDGIYSTVLDMSALSTPEIPPLKSPPCLWISNRKYPPPPCPQISIIVNPPSPSEILKAVHRMVWIFSGIAHLLYVTFNVIIKIQLDSEA